jgi:hypothetical protein
MVRRSILLVMRIRVTGLNLPWLGAGPFTGRDPWNGIAAHVRHVSPDALPMSAVSAREPDGAYAIG